MNRPVFAYSGANAGVTEWIDAASGSGVLVDYTAQRRPCYCRTPDRPGPHNLLLDPACAQPVAGADSPGPARPLWATDAGWVPPVGVAASPDTSFDVPMDGVAVAVDVGRERRRLPPVAGRPAARRRLGCADSPRPTWWCSRSCTCRRPSTPARPTRSPSARGTPWCTATASAIDADLVAGDAVRPVRVLRRGDGRADPARHRRHVRGAHPRLSEVLLPAPRHPRDPHAQPSCVVATRRAIR